MKVFRKIKNKKLYRYLSKYKDDIIKRIISNNKLTLSSKEFRRLYMHMEIIYLKDISKINNFDELPIKWFEHFEKTEIQQIILKEKQQKKFD